MYKYIDVINTFLIDPVSNDITFNIQETSVVLYSISLQYIFDFEQLIIEIMLFNVERLQIIEQL